MKKLFILLLVACLLVGCSSGKSKSDKEPIKEGLAIYSWMFSKDCDLKTSQKLLGKPDFERENEEGPFPYTTYRWDNYTLLGRRGTLEYNYGEHDNQFKWTTKEIALSYAFKVFHDELSSKCYEVTHIESPLNSEVSSCIFELFVNEKGKNAMGGTYFNYCGGSLRYDNEHIVFSWGPAIVGMREEDTPFETEFETKD